MSSDAAGGVGAPSACHVAAVDQCEVVRDDYVAALEEASFNLDDANIMPKLPTLKRMPDLPTTKWETY